MIKKAPVTRVHGKTWCLCLQYYGRVDRGRPGEEATENELQRERTRKKHQGLGKVGEKARLILWLRSLSECIFLCLATLRNRLSCPLGGNETKWKNVKILPLKFHEGKWHGYDTELGGRSWSLEERRAARAKAPCRVP